MHREIIFLLLLQILNIFGQNNDSLGKNIHVYLNSTNEIRMKTPANVTLTIVSDEETIDEDFIFECSDTYLCTVYNDSKIKHVSLNKENNYTTNMIVDIDPTFLGVTRINIEPVENGSKFNISYTSNMKIHKTKSGQVWEYAFSIVVTYFITFVTFLMGTQLHVNVILNILKKPIGPIVSIICQFLFMPLVAYGLCLTVLKDEPNFVKFCFIAAGSSPGGGKSSFWTIIFDGNLNLSVCLTFVQTVCASLMMPLWMTLIGKQFLANENISVPYIGLVKAIFNLIIPCIVGMLTVHYKPKLVQNAQKYIKVATWTSTIVFTMLGVFVYHHIFLMITLPILIASCILPWSGYILAYIVGTLCKLPIADVITVSIETGVQNVGLAIMMLMYSFQEPELDIAMVAPIVVILATDKPLIIIWLIKKMYKKYCSSDNDKKDNISLPRTG
uniref:Ileal sodium/bile acid cotransporter-like n=1 Tax=Parastrongyloides trichosuri TaxID=131310 RepID=A0A0N4ZH16_PARTI